MSNIFHCFSFATSPKRNSRQAFLKLSQTKNVYSFIALAICHDLYLTSFFPSKNVTFKLKPNTITYGMLHRFK